MAGHLRVHVGATLQIPVLQITGDLIHGESLAELSIAVKQLLSEGETRVVLELARLKSVDSAGIAALLDVKKIVGESGRVVVLRPPQQMRQALRVMRIEHLFEIAEDEAELQRPLE
jgi:anti-anti-sigma factor